MYLNLTPSMKLLFCAGKWRCLVAAGFIFSTLSLSVCCCPLLATNAEGMELFDGDRAKVTSRVSKQETKYLQNDDEGRFEHPSSAALNAPKQKTLTDAICGAVRALGKMVFKCTQFALNNPGKKLIFGLLAYTFTDAVFAQHCTTAKQILCKRFQIDNGCCVVDWESAALFPNGQDGGIDIYGIVDTYITDNQRSPSIAGSINANTEMFEQRIAAKRLLRLPSQEILRDKIEECGHTSNFLEKTGLDRNLAGERRDESGIHLAVLLAYYDYDKALKNDLLPTQVHLTRMGSMEYMKPSIIKAIIDASKEIIEGDDLDD